MTALDESETMGFDAMKERFKRAHEGGCGVMDKHQMDYEHRELQKVCEDEHAREKAVAAGKELAANVTTSKKAKKSKPIDDKKRN